MPNNNFEMMECSDILRYEDILFASEVFASLGVNRIRITGGEPLVRKEICQFLDKLTKIENIQEVMLTTNGALLEKYNIRTFHHFKVIVRHTVFTAEITSVCN